MAKRLKIYVVYSQGSVATHIRLFKLFQ